MLGRAFLDAGYVHEAIDTLRDLIESYELKGDTKSIDMTYWYGRALEQKGDMQTALQAYSRVAQLCMDSDDAAGAAAWGARALELAETMGEAEIIIHTLNSVGTAALLSGDERGRDELERSLALATEAGLEDAVSRALTHLAWAAVRRRDYAVATGRLETALRHASDHGVELRRGYLLGYRALLELDLGRWAEENVRPVIESLG